MCSLKYIDMSRETQAQRYDTSKVVRRMELIFNTDWRQDRIERQYREKNYHASVCVHLYPKQGIIVLLLLSLTVHIHRYN